ncbi:MAG: EamA family transporter [Eubacteriales bacterium]|nr:EamA family transporter [Eubacteriales bacterium]
MRYIFTLFNCQTPGQKGMNPTMAALILSLESVFSALAGFVILHQVLSLRELFGCALMFVAIVLAQLPDFPGKKD